MTPEETVNAFIAAVTGGDWDRAAELAAEDIVYENRGFAPTAVEEALPVVNERTDKFTFGETRIELPVTGVFEVIDGGSRSGATTRT